MQNYQMMTEARLHILGMLTSEYDQVRKILTVMMETANNIPSGKVQLFYTFCFLRKRILWSSFIFMYQWRVYRQKIQM